MSGNNGEKQSKEEDHLTLLTKTQKERPLSDGGLMSRRALLSSMGAAGLAFAAEGLLGRSAEAASGMDTVTETVYGEPHGLAALAVDLPLEVEDIAALLVLDAESCKSVVVCEPLRGGIFIKENLTSTTASGDGGITFAASGGGRWRRLFADHAKPEWFGCVGDGLNDDYGGWEKTVNYINAAGGGVIVLRKDADYLLDRYVIDEKSGLDSQNPSWTGNGVKDIWFKNVNGLVIHGNHAKLSVKGNFHRRYHYSYNGYGYSYDRSLTLWPFSRCSNVTIHDVELDGNGDLTTRDIAVTAEPGSSGLKTVMCSNFSIHNLYSHHHLMDGWFIGLFYDSEGTFEKLPDRNHAAYNCRFTYNARQGVSVIQLVKGIFINCDFSDTGKAAYGSHAPASGVDIEPEWYQYASNSALQVPEGDQTQQITFLRCRFERNTGLSAIAAFSDRSRDITYRDCLFDSRGSSPTYTAIFSAENTLVERCTFHLKGSLPLSYPPAMGGGTHQRTTFIHNKINAVDGVVLSIDASDSNQYVIVDHNDFEFDFTSRTVLGEAIWLSGAFNKFTNNKVHMKLNAGQVTGNLIVNRFIDIAFCENNEYTTSLTGSATISNTYGDAPYRTPYIRNERFLSQARFQADYFTSYTSNKIYTRVPENLLYGFGAPSFGSIAAGGSVDKTIAVTGAVIGDVSLTAPNVAPSLGFSIYAFVSAANTVTIRVTNCTNSTAVFSDRSWYVTVFPRKD
ncbi:hypothetical protein [Paenibacillus contaminans]|uniref:Pectate lyase superfamily protein domain-containing protein n=1 Tax=Paenibacillus contaminans TaxID=450362 RepID=A0A329MJM6_9BACL|nr:hypothetical protein [Paenibacillus contaminans]RAV20059.1 hypothetical protein DQG23_16425 [Paenibacillus contaminans]